MTISRCCFDICQITGLTASTTLQAFFRFTTSHAPAITIFLNITLKEHIPHLYDYRIPNTTVTRKHNTTLRCTLFQQASVAPYYDRCAAHSSHLRIRT